MAAKGITPTLANPSDCTQAGRPIGQLENSQLENRILMTGQNWYQHIVTNFVKSDIKMRGPKRDN